MKKNSSISSTENRGKKPAPVAVDRIFSEKTKQVTDFDFSTRTAQVFDDMLDRSVPFYQEIQNMMGRLAADNAVPGTSVYDLGCSTGTTLVLLDGILPADVKLVGVDNSEAMLVKTREKVSTLGTKRKIDFEFRDLDTDLHISNASVVILNLTLQFIRPLHRERVIKEIASGLKKDGCLILVEKVLAEDAAYSRSFIKYYYDFKKKNGYSEMEISQKREALENVLIPYKTKENEDLLLSCGFSSCEIFFKWFNFCGYIARKGA